MTRTMNQLPKPRPDFDKRTGTYRGVYYCAWPAPKCSWRSKGRNCKGHKDGLSGFTSKKAAEKAARDRQQHELDLYNAAATPAGDASTTLGAIAEDFFATEGGTVSNAGPSGQLHYRNLWTAWCKTNPIIPATAIGNVTETTAIAWLNGLRADGASTSTLKNYRAILRLITGYAATQGHVKSNPLGSMGTVTAPAKPKTEADDLSALTEAELWKLYGTIRDCYKPMILLQGFLGMRWGEAVAAKPEDFYSIGDQLLVHVQRQYNKNLNQITGPKGSKDGKLRDRHTPVWAFIDGLRDELQSWIDHAVDSGHEYLVVSPTGKRVGYGNVRRDFAKALTAAGLPTTVTTHHLRRSAATLLVNDYHVSVPIAADTLGHDARTLETYYRQTAKPSQILSAVAHIGAAVAASTAPELHIASAAPVTVEAEAV